VSASLIFGDGANATALCSGSIVSEGYNVFDQEAPCTTLAATDSTTYFPTLDTSGPSYLPKFYGGLGPVYMPLPGSPLLSFVNDVGYANDERGAGRPSPWCAAGSAEPIHAVIVVGNTSKLTAGDNNVVNQLTTIFGAGNVSIVGDTWSGSPDGRVIVVTGSVNDSHIGTRFQSMSEGFLILKQSLFDKMQMTASSSNEGTTNLTALRLSGQIPASAGYTSGGYSSGNDPVLTSSSQPYGWGNNVTSTGYVVMGVVPSNTNHAGVFQSPPLDSSGPNRVGFFATDGAAAALTSVGDRLLQQAALAASSFFVD
jgi:hypothetical protein